MAAQAATSLGSTLTAATRQHWGARSIRCWSTSLDMEMDWKEDIPGAQLAGIAGMGYSLCYILFSVCIYSHDIPMIPGSSKKTAIHRKPQSYPAYPRNPQLQCCDRKCRTSSTEMAVFFEGRQTHNSEDNIELGDGGGMTSAVWYFMGWLFFLKNPVRFFLVPSSF